jgi:hypothetical protein
VQGMPEQSRTQRVGTARWGGSLGGSRLDCFNGAVDERSLECEQWQMHCDRLQRVADLRSLPLVD